MFYKVKEKTECNRGKTSFYHSVLFHHAGLMDHAHVGVGEGGGGATIMTKAKGNTAKSKQQCMQYTLSSLLLLSPAVV